MKFPLCFYPSSTIWIDDDKQFLQSVGSLSDIFGKIVTFSSANACLEYVLDKQKGSYIADKFIRIGEEDDNYGSPDHMTTDIDIGSIKELRNYSDRCAETSVMIVDYEMEEMNGVELCRQLSNYPMKKILLTGKADHAVAIAAFNERLIDGFLQKDDNEIKDSVISTIRLLKRQFFYEKTNHLLSHLETGEPKHFSDKAFVKFFDEWNKKNGITEYYLLDKYGNFILKDATGKEFYFVVHTDETLNEFIKLYQREEGTAEFLTLVENRNKIPWFGENIGAWEVPVDIWEKHLYSPQLIQGRKDYYWVAVSL